MIVLDAPPQLILPERPAIIRPGVDIERYFPFDMNRHDRRAVIKELVDAGRLPPEQARQVTRAMAIPFGQFKGNALAPFSVTWAGNGNVNPGSGNVHTVTGVSYGTAPTGSNLRYVFVYVGSSRIGSNKVNSLTIGGVAATIVAQQASAVENGGCFAYVAMQTGTSGSVVVTYDNSNVQCTGVVSWSVINPSSLTPVTSATPASSSSGSISLSLNNASPRVILAGAMCRDGSDFSWTFSGGTKRVGADARTGEWYSGIDGTTAGTPVAITATSSSSAQISGISISIN